MRLVLSIFFVLLFIGAPHAQVPARAFRIAQTIKFLETGRADVRNLFAGFEADLADESESDTFESRGIEVEVSYADGECSNNPDEKDFASIWNVANGKVVQIEISFAYPVALSTFNRHASKLTREQDDDDEPNSYVLFSKSSGILFKIEEGGVEHIILFPPAATVSSLCEDNGWGRQFYSSKTWFGEFQLGWTNSGNLPAYVSDLRLSSSVINATANKSISVVASAIDAENDVVTYNYVVSGGRIVGTGSKVVWDLTGVPPGTYTITAGVDDGCGICGRTATKSITVN
jgi:hypothetical protein